MTPVAASPEHPVSGQGQPALRMLLPFVLCLAALSAPSAFAQEPATGEAKTAEEKEAEERKKKQAEAAAESAEDLPTYAETMVVTASRTEESLLDVPVSTTVIGGEQIEVAAGDTYADLLRGVPGLNIVQNSARDINFVSRGATSTLATSQLAMVDGRSIYQDFFGFVMWDVLPVNFDEIDQIEVLRGPGSAMWGANALAGVVNVRTKSPRETPGGLFKVGAGEIGTRSASVRFADAFDKGSYRIAASWFEQDAWERNSTLPDGTPLPPEAAFANEGSEQPKFDFRFDWDPSEKRKFSYKAGYAGTDGIMHTGIGPFTIDSGTNVMYGEFAYAGPQLEAKAYVNVIDGDATNLLNALPFAFENNTYVADATWRKVLGERNLLLIGGNARLNRFDLSLAPDEDSREEVGFFIEDQIMFGEKGILSLGGRVDWFDTVGTTFSPRISYVFKPRPNHSLRFAYNQAYRAPSLINNYLNTVVPNAVTLAPMTPPFVFFTNAVGNPDLDEETVEAFEIGYTVEVKGHTFSAAVYRNESKDLIDFYPSQFYSSSDPPAGWPLPPAFVPPNTLPKEFTYRNVGKVEAQGLELSWNARWANGLSSVVTYAFQDDNEASDNDPTQPLVLNQPSEHQLTAGINVQKEHWKGSFSASYVDEAFWSDVLDARYWGTTEEYILVSGLLGWENERWGVALSGTNLTDEEIQQHVFGDILRRKMMLEFKVKW